MCGIVGALSAGSLPPGAVIDAMRDCIAHRGPDAAATWSDPSGGVALGHRRLSVLDLSPTGAQPMASASGRYVIAFNGEVYNFRQLQRELEREGRAPGWRGTSDTEVLLACFDAWGVAATLPRLNAMFAFAVWDVRERTLTLARDRFGEKPLYYGRAGSSTVFASELKAIRSFPGFDGAIDADALASYFRYAYIPSPFSIYRNVRKLPAGHFLTLRASDATLPDPVPFWDPSAMAMQTRDGERSEKEWIDELDALLRDAIALRMVADVPLGAFLSGGVDSTTVVALMQAQSSRPVKTFTIGNHAGGYDEAQHAREVARLLGTEHTELYVSASDALAVVPRLASMYDEPFADSSAIPTFLVSQLARRHVTVSLSGDGGDELFGGYNRHFHGPRVWGRVVRMPLGLRRAAARSIESIAPGTWDRFGTAAGRFVSREFASGTAGDKLHKLARSLRTTDGDAFYESLVGVWGENVLASGQRAGFGGRQPRLQTPAGSGAEIELVQGGPGLQTSATRGAGSRLPLAERMMFADMMRYLPDDILVKVDRASMAVSLEGRVPFLDPRVAELAWRMPLRHKVGRSQGKLIVRSLLDRYVPRALMDRPKQGFAIPVGEWLRHELREWAEELLAPSKLRQDGILDTSVIEETWREHLSGRSNHDVRLWSVLMFQAWLAAGR